jgi:hypothetical protein
LYEDEDLLWVANVGVLQQKVTKDNWLEKTAKTELFAHNIQVGLMIFCDYNDDNTISLSYFLV